MPLQNAPPPVFLTPYALESVGIELSIIGNINATSQAFPTANKAFYYPFSLRSPATVKRLFWVNGAASTRQNIQVGIYDDLGNSIVLGTSTLASGDSQPQFDDIADTPLAAGKRYYMAIWGAGNTTTILRMSLTTTMQRELGMWEQLSLTGGLPSTATFATPTGVSAPVLFGLAFRSTP